MTPYSTMESDAIGAMRHFETPLGEMVTVCTDDGVRLLEFRDRRGLEAELRDLAGRLHCRVVMGENALTRQLGRELEEYFGGTRHEFTVPLKPPGTPFQRSVWDALCRIPYGQTRSYGEQARAIGQPTATRAVAHANGDNPVAIVIPCHRVIGADGKLTGYGGGLWRKQYLLDLESVQGQLAVQPGRLAGQGSSQPTGRNSGRRFT
jgi:AraC family transcriptional regulator, regulatory protein of adaptative response / methylated-DNA-[protein]-cysteine methyltransferase